MPRFFVGSLLIAAISLGATDDTDVKEKLKDDRGAAIANATVFVPTTSIRSTRTDRDGNFSLALPSDGLYDVFVSAPGFTPSCAKLQVRKHQWAVFSPTLKLDRLTAKLLGDEFDTKPPRSQKR